MSAPVSVDLAEGRVLLIDKPLRWTSFDAVHRTKRKLLEELLMGVDDPTERRALKKRLKVGHAGTLDPLATGLLILCTGKMTRQIQDIQSQEKEYTGTMVFGAVTPTYDLESEPVPFGNPDGIDEAALREAALRFTGRLLQSPPAHSAVKIGGRRAYELARKGEEVTIKPKEVEIKVFELTGFRLPEVHFRVVCSKGTYIRSLAHDLGQALGCGAYLSALRRTRIGNYRVEDAVSPATRNS
jgi:tRNA pseudouridine55 synthase